DKALTITDVAQADYAPMGPLTDKVGVGLEASGSFSPNPPSHPNGAHLCELEVDPETGEVVIDRYFVVDDLGRVLNPIIVRGQIHGGVGRRPRPPPPQPPPYHTPTHPPLSSCLSY